MLEDSTLSVVEESTLSVVEKSTLSAVEDCSLSTEVQTTSAAVSLTTPEEEIAVAQGRSVWSSNNVSTEERM